VVKTSKFKLQTPGKVQTPNFKRATSDAELIASVRPIARALPARDFKLEAWSFSEVWSLKFEV
jgi:hypothetical protein